MKGKTKKNVPRLICLLVYLIPPLILACWHFNANVVNETVSPSENNLNISGLSKELPIDNPQNISEDEFLARMPENTRSKTDSNSVNSILYLLNIQPEFIRYSINIKNNVALKMSYSDSLEGDIQQGQFKFTLSCVGQNIGQEYNWNGLKFKDGANENNPSVKNILKNCVYFPYGGFKNDTGHNVYVHSIDGLSSNSTINIVIKIDPVIEVILIVGWYVFWIGLLILLREGPGKYFKIKD